MGAGAGKQGILVICSDRRGGGGGWGVLVSSEGMEAKAADDIFQLKKNTQSFSTTLRGERQPRRFNFDSQRLQF